jgi:hypothetical protein
VWDACEGQAGLRDAARKFITLIAAGGQKDKPINVVCNDCRELKAIHKGDRLNLVVQSCKCDVTEFEDSVQKLGRPPPKTERQQAKRPRGFGSDLDPDGSQGTLATYNRKCTLLDDRYPGQGFKAVATALLGNDLNLDEAGSSASIGVTGEQGGKVLACFLVRAEKAGGEDAKFLTKGSMAWLTKQLPKCLLHPTAKLCVEQAMKFLPKLYEALAGPEKGSSHITLDFGDDDEDDADEEEGAAEGASG